jgi:hypothetical protein
MLTGKRLQNYQKFQDAVELAKPFIVGTNEDPAQLFAHLIPSLKISLKNKNKLLVKLSIKGTSDKDIFDLVLLNAKDSVIESYSGKGFQDLTEILLNSDQ